MNYFGISAWPGHGTCHGFQRGQLPMGPRDPNRLPKRGFAEDLQEPMVIVKNRDHLATKLPGPKA